MTCGGMYQCDTNKYTIHSERHLCLKLSPSIVDNINNIESEKEEYVKEATSRPRSR